MTRREMVALLGAAPAATWAAAEKGVPQPLAFESIEVAGDLSKRAGQNFDRLEAPYYAPPRVFASENAQKWPGDVEGRTVLALTLLARSTHREARYLDAILEQYPGRMNEEGYFGPRLNLKAIDEQQLSGHGWVLRGLSEHVEWRRDGRSQQMIERVVRNLALPTRGQHSSYPIDPVARKHGTGGAFGDIASQIGNWKVSTDIGCDFIFLDGVTHAYKVLRTPALKALADEMIARYLEVDLVRIQAQAHASLTGLRALLRHHEETGNQALLAAAEQRYRTYRAEAMTENYANYNWFGRATATEPCAIIDSFIVAMQLWQHTGRPSYLEDAHLIYFNGLGRGQRNNGGYGTDTCAGASDPFLKVRHYEAYWCCTMRGGEGNARAIQYLYFSRPGELTVPMYGDSTATVDLGGGKVRLRQETGYPYEGTVTLEVVSSSLRQPVALRFAAPAWTRSHRVRVNGKEVAAQTGGGFAVVRTGLLAGDTVQLDFALENGWRDPINRHTIRGYRAFFAGPLMLGCATATEVKLAADGRMSPDGRGQFRAEPGGVRLTRINDLNELAVTESDPCLRQVLFQPPR